MREITLHLLDITENSVSAGAKNIKIEVCEDLHDDLLLLSVQDDGKGMDAHTVATISDPFVTSRTTRNVGLGIPLLKDAAVFCNGGLTIDSKLGKGTTITVTFQHSHIDRMPLGDLPATLLSLVIAHNDIHWKFYYSYRSKNGRLERFEFDDGPIKETLGDVPLSTPEVLGYIRQMLEEGIAGCYHK